MNTMGAFSLGFLVSAGIFLVVMHYMMKQVFVEGYTKGHEAAQNKVNQEHSVEKEYKQ